MSPLQPKFEKISQNVISQQVYYLVAMDDSGKRLLEHYKNIYEVSYDFRNENLTRLVASYVKKDGVVLDIGCGSGFLLDELSRRGVNAIGVEPNRDLIELSKKRNTSLAILEGRAEDIGAILKEKVRTAIMIDVLEHIEDDASFLKTLAPHIEDGGEVIIVVPAYQFLYGLRDRKYGHYRRYSKRMLRRRLRGSGFSVLFIRNWNILGVLPYIVSEKILGKELETSLRKKTNSALGGILQRILRAWFRWIENPINFGFGLSIVCIAKKQEFINRAAGNSDE